jgi:hypothetical protein
MDDCVGHGTHVAGTIAAQLKNNEYGFVGAAPGAKLAAYRMWGCTSRSTVEIELAAFAAQLRMGRTSFRIPTASSCSLKFVDCFTC